jgi:hypothetical protein
MTTSTSVNRRILFARWPVGAPVPGDFKTVSEPMPTANPGQVLPRISRATWELDGLHCSAELLLRAASIEACQQCSMIGSIEERGKAFRNFLEPTTNVFTM